MGKGVSERMHRKSHIAVVLLTAYFFVSGTLFDAALAFDSNNLEPASSEQIETALYQANQLMEKKDFANALNIIEPFSLLKPHSSKILKCKGQICFALEKYEDALEAYNEAIDLQTGDIRLYRNRADVLLQLNKNEEAIADLNQVLDRRVDAKLTNREESAIYGIKSEAYKKLNKDVQELKCLNLAISTDPTNIYRVVMRGKYYARRLDPIAAINDYKHATILDPKCAIAYLGRGEEYLNIAADEQAIVELDKYISITQDDPYAYYLRARAFSNVGNFEQANKDVLKSSSFDKTNKDALEELRAKLKTSHNNSRERRNLADRYIIAEQEKQKATNAEKECDEICKAKFKDNLRLKSLSNLQIEKVSRDLGKKAITSEEADKEMSKIATNLLLSDLNKFTAYIKNANASFIRELKESSRLEVYSSIRVSDIAFSGEKSLTMPKLRTFNSIIKTDIDWFNEKILPEIRPIISKMKQHTEEAKKANDLPAYRLAFLDLQKSIKEHLQTLNAALQERNKLFEVDRILPAGQGPANFPIFENSKVEEEALALTKALKTIETSLNGN